MRKGISRVNLPEESSFEPSAQPAPSSIPQPEASQAPRPVPPYTPPVPIGGRGSGWIAFLRIFLWFWFTLVCVSGAFGGMYFVHMEEFGLAALVLFGSILLAFLSIAGGMVALDAACNLKACADYSAEIAALLRRK